MCINLLVINKAYFWFVQKKSLKRIIKNKEWIRTVEYPSSDYITFIKFAKVLILARLSSNKSYFPVWIYGGLKQKISGILLISRNGHQYWKRLSRWCQLPSSFPTYLYNKKYDI